MQSVASGLGRTVHARGAGVLSEEARGAGSNCWTQALCRPGLGVRTLRGFVLGLSLPHLDSEFPQV